MLLRGIGGLSEIAETIGCPRLGPPSGCEPHDERLGERVSGENVQTNRIRHLDRPAASVSRVQSRRVSVENRRSYGRRVIQSGLTKAGEEVLPQARYF